MALMPIRSKFPSLIGQGVFLDCETTGLKWWVDKIFGIAVRVGGNSYYFDVRETPGVFKWLSAELPRVKWLDNHNIKFDYHFLLMEGVPMDQVPVRCTMVDAALVDEHEFSYDLDTLCKKHLGRGKDRSIEEEGRKLLGLKASSEQIKANLHRLPSGVVGAYASIDVELAELLRSTYLDRQIVDQSLERVVGLERNLLPVLVRMEQRGVRVDVEGAEKAGVILDKQAIALQKQVDSLAGRPLNINSPKQIIEVFAPKKEPGERGRWYIEVRGRAIYIGRTEGGAPSMDAETLRRIPGELSGAILTLRKTIKTRDTFIRGHILGYHRDGIVHANINQTKGDNEMGTGTGRLSYNAPALQQIHKRNAEIAAIVRSLFIPYERQKWISADWDQKEFRWFAHYSKNAHILKMYDDDADTDFHAAVAKLTGLPRSPKDGFKGNAKQINLGLVFGMGMGRLAQEMGLPYEERERHGKAYLVPGPEAEAIFEKYHESIPGIKDLLDQAASVARTRGFVSTAGGRHIRFPRGQFVHKAAGLIFQGTAADCMKYKLIEHDKEWEGTDTHLLLSVHDETDFSTPGGDPKVIARIKEINEAFDGVRCPIKCRVPIRCTVREAINWWEACKE